MAYVHKSFNRFNCRIWTNHTLLNNAFKNTNDSECNKSQCYCDGSAIELFDVCFDCYVDIFCKIT